MQVVRDGKVLTIDVEAATAGLIEGQRKRLETVSQRDWAGRTADATRSAGLRHARPLASVAARSLSIEHLPRDHATGMPEVVEYSKCSGVSGWTSA